MQNSKKPSLGAEIVERAKAADRRLRTQPRYARMLGGDVDRDEYAAWLVQIHRYVRHTVPGELRLAEAMGERAGRDPSAKAVRAYAQHEATEESGHDDLILSDLAVLWDVTPEEAGRRVDAEAPAPSVAAWERVASLMHATYPEGIIGFGLALETLASLSSDEMREGLLARRTIPEIGSAVAFLEAHSATVEGEHSMGASAIADALSDPVARSAASFFADHALALYEGIVRYNSERFAARVDAVLPS
jgi:hypothetical protein